jgi:hypothetical protein
MDKKKRNKHLTLINDLLHLLHKWIFLLIACHCIVFFCPKKHFFCVCYLCAMQSKDTITENLWWPSHCCRRRLQNELTGSICRGSHLKVDPALQLSSVPDIRLELEQHFPMRKILRNAHQDRISGSKL